MNLQHDKFAYYYALYFGERGAKAKAGRDAGFKDPHAGMRLLKNPKIVERVEYYKKKIKDEIEMSAKEIISGLQKIARREGIYKGTVKDAREAFKDLAKYKQIQGFTDKLVIEHKIPFTDEKVWTVEALVEFIRTGKVPKGAKLPDLESLGPLISRLLSEKSGESIN